MKVKRDYPADAAYVTLNPGVYAYGQDLDKYRRIDYDQNGKAIGIELLCVSNGILIEGLPQREELIYALIAIKIKVFSVETKLINDIMLIRLSALPVEASVQVALGTLTA